MRDQIPDLIRACVRGKFLDGKDGAVLIAMSEFGDELGRGVYATNARIAMEMVPPRSAKTVQRTRARLIKSGWLKKAGTAVHRGYKIRVWDINLHRLKAAKTLGGQNLDPANPKNPEKSHFLRNGVGGQNAFGVGGQIVHQLEQHSNDALLEPSHERLGTDEEGLMAVPPEPSSHLPFGDGPTKGPDGPIAGKQDQAAPSLSKQPCGPVCKSEGALMDLGATPQEREDRTTVFLGPNVVCDASVFFRGHRVFFRMRSLNCGHAEFVLVAPGAKGNFRRYPITKPWRSCNAVSELKKHHPARAASIQAQMKRLKLDAVAQFFEGAEVLDLQAEINRLNQKDEIPF